MLEEPLRGLAESIRDGLIVVEGDGLRWSNVAFGAMAGRVGACLAGLPVRDVLTDMPEASGGEGPMAFETQLLHTDGRPRAVRCRRAWSVEGESAVAWLVEDLDLPRALEAELLQRSRELARGNREIAQLQNRFETERGKWEELRATWGHEMRTPLMVVRGYIRLLLSEDSGPLKSQQRRFLEESWRGCERLGGFLDELLDASLSEQGEVRLDAGRGDLTPVVEDVAAMFRPLLLDRELKLDLVFGQTPPVRFDAPRIEQVLMNLLGNAVKHAPPGSSIRIGVHALEPCASGESCVEVVVEDEGPGIAACDAERVFEPYVQLRNGKAVEGLGLGLSICRRLVEAHGGTIRVDRSRSRGACFAFTLPLSTGAESSFPRED